MIIEDQTYYRVRIKAEHNYRTHNDVDRIFLLNNGRFDKLCGFGIQLYEATLLKAQLTRSTKKAFNACNENEDYRWENVF
jgi:hypothetical protein